MFIYLLLLAAVAASPELPTDITATDMQELQELVAIFTQEEMSVLVNPAETVATATPATLVAPQATPITITNAIDPSMLEYKHWTGKYSPEIFTVSVNNTPVECGTTCEIPAGTSTIEVSYTYSFMNGMRTGGKTISYQLNENITQANITFNWQDDWRVVVDNGKAIKEILTT